MEQDYWRKQEVGKPLFPDTEWSKPERKSARGKLLIVGGSKNGFMSVGKAFTVANETGAGEVKIAMPDVVKNNMPKGFSEGIFLPTNSGGGLSINGSDELLAARAWADGILLIGDSGMNAETAQLFERLLDAASLPGLSGQSSNFLDSPIESANDNTRSKWITITRDAVDLVMDMGEKLVNLPNVHLVMNFTQIQKLFQKVYYPRPLLFSQQLSNVIESLHKFTITYPVVITIQHQDHLIVAHAGQVVTQKSDDPYPLIDGTLATKSATYLLWSPTKPLEAIVSSLA